MGGVRRIARIGLGMMVGIASLGLVGTTFGEDGFEVLPGLMDWDSPSCLDDSVVGRLEAELGKLGTTAALCDATALKRLLSSDLAALNRGCIAIEGAALDEVVGILADPEMSEFSCEDGLSLVAAINKAFRDGVAQEEASEPRPPAETRDERSFDELLGDLEARERSTGCLLGRTIADIIKQKVERNWSVPRGVLDAGEMVVTLRIMLGPDGSVRRVEIVDTDGAGSYRTMAESARRAVLKASPFEGLTRYVDNYEGCWRKINLTFSPPV